MNDKAAIIAFAVSAGSSAALAGPIYANDFELTVDSPDAVWSSSDTHTLAAPYTTFLGNFGNETVRFRLLATEDNTASLGGGGNDAYGNVSVRKLRDHRSHIPAPDSAGGGHAGSGDTPPFTYSGPRVDLGNAISQAGTQGEPAFRAGTYALRFDLLIFDSWDATYEGYGPDSFSVAVNGQVLFEEFIEVHWLPNNFRMPDELPELNAFNSAWQDMIFRDITIFFEVDQDTDAFDFEFIGSLDQRKTDESWGIDNVRVEAVGQVLVASAPVVPAPATLTLLAGAGALGARRRRR